MKLIKKLSIALICALCVACVCLTVTACNSDPDANLPENTYVFYVYLDDGTTGVEGVSLEICYNTETSALCLTESAVTDANGRAEIDLSSIAQYSSYNQNGFCVHFAFLAGDTKPIGFPDGYTYPEGGQTITLNVGVYENAWYLTQQVTTFKLVKE